MEKIIAQALKKEYTLCFISGLLLTVAFAFRELFWLNFIAMIPLFLVLLSCEYGIKKLMRYVFFFSLGYYIPTIHWLYEITVLFPVSKPASIAMITLGIFLIGIVQGLYTFLAFMLFPFIKSGRYRDVFFLSSLYILAEYLQEYTFFAPFPWAKIGVSLAPFSAFIQSASLFGVYFISFLILFLNGSLAFILLNRDNFKKIRPVFFTIGIILSANIAFGTLRIAFSQKEADFDGLAVQGNYSGLDKWRNTTSEMFNGYCELTRKGVSDKTKIVVWPETAINTDINVVSQYKDELVKLSDELNVTIVTGYFTYQDNDMMYNSIFAVSPNGRFSEPYNKHVLVPFGEYFPMSDAFKKLFPSFDRIVTNASNILKGNDFQIMDSSVGRIGGIICYDSLFTDVARNNSKLGADIFVLPSNDSWFGDSSALYQHNCQAIMRAVENNRFIIRASNTGISSIISPTGKVLAQAETFVPTALSAPVSLIEKRTLYSYIGNIIIVIPTAVYVLCLFFALKKVRRKNLH